MKPTFPATHSMGPSTRLVTVTALTDDGLTAICTDRKGYEVRVPYLYQRAKGILPLTGENWLLSQDTGQWTFALFLGTDPSVFPVLDTDDGGGGGGSDDDAYDNSLLNGPGWDPGLDNLILAAGDPQGVARAPQLIQGVIYLSRFRAMLPYSVSNLVYMFGDGTQSGTAHAWVGMFDRNGTQLADSGDIGSTLASVSDGSVIIPLGSTVNLNQGEVAYAAILSNFSGDQLSVWGYAPPTSCFVLNADVHSGGAYGFDSGAVGDPYPGPGMHSSLPSTVSFSYTSDINLVPIWAGAF